MLFQGREDAGKSDVTRTLEVAGCRGAAVRCVIGASEDGGSRRRRLWLRDGSQTETDNPYVGRAHAGASPAERPLQETETHVQVERLRFRGRHGALAKSVPGSDGDVSAAAAGGSPVHLVSAVRRHRLQNPEGEGDALSSVQELGSTATSRTFLFFLHHPC